MVATVVGLQGALAGKRFAVGDESITFGRGDENDVVLPSENSSIGVHAVLRQEDDAFILQDRGSSNGTWVNGARVTLPTNSTPATRS